MYKVVIVDDEDIIVQGLKAILPWEQYNCEIVGTANDGAEGAQLIDKLTPDILFTDICMSDTSGLDMVASIRERHPDMQIAIITGYRNFEYAQKAINLGVCRFLLKPTKMDEPLEALKTMVTKLGGENAETSEPSEFAEKGSGSFIVCNALKYIEAHYNERLTLIEVAENTYVSQWHLSKLLKKHTNLSFCDLLSQVRIKNAKNYLNDPSLKIHEISELVGFTDVTHFSKIFRKFEGVSPNEYRNNIIAKM